MVTSIALELVGKAVSGPNPNLLKCNLFPRLLVCTALASPRAWLGPCMMPSHSV